MWTKSMPASDPASRKRIVEARSGTRAAGLGRAAVEGAETRGADVSPTLALTGVAAPVRAVTLSSRQPTTVASRSPRDVIDRAVRMTSDRSTREKTKLKAGRSPHNKPGPDVRLGRESPIEPGTRRSWRLNTRRR